MADELSEEAKAVVVLMATADLQRELALFNAHTTRLAEKLNRFADAIQAVQRVPHLASLPNHSEPQQTPGYDK